MEDTEFSLRIKKAGEMVYDPTTCVRTSVRRESEEGYLSVFLTYAQAYVSHYVLNRKFEGEYFESQERE